MSTFITLRRVWRDERSTLGIIKIVGLESEPPFFSMELPWKDNALRVSCIPDGNYPWEKWYSPTFKREVIRLRDESVMPRSAILCHVANEPTEILGCIAPGMRWAKWDSGWGVASSKMALDKIMAELPDSGRIDIGYA